MELAWDADEHAGKVERVLQLLRAGDTYQINLTFPVHFHFDGDPLELYAALRAAQPAAHGGLIIADEMSILSVSPELFIETKAGTATTRPMKGTVARGVDGDADMRAAAELRCDVKQRAENLMIVDLLRNDLSRISAVGSVVVPQLFTVSAKLAWSLRSKFEH